MFDAPNILNPLTRESEKMPFQAALTHCPSRNSGGLFLFHASVVVSSQ